MGAKERILTLRLLEKLERHPRWCCELGLEAKGTEGSEEAEKKKGENLWNL
jgi:hypothetical protein